MPKRSSTRKASSAAPERSSTALMICTQEVASMPPKSTYAIIAAPTIMIAVSYESPKSSLISPPAPTIWAMRYRVTVASVPTAAATRIGFCCSRTATASAKVYLPRLRSGSAIRKSTTGQPTSQPVE